MWLALACRSVASGIHHLQAMYWDKEIETLGRESLERLQLQRLNATLERASRAPFYRDRLGKEGGRSLRSLAELTRLPFTTKAELRDAFPYGFLAAPLSSIVRLHSSSGTTGNPTVIYHTREDIEAWQDLVARCMYMTGMRKTDVFQNMMGYGLFTGGLGFHYGAEKLGALTIPIGPGTSKRQIWFMREFATTVIHILPSYALRLSTHVQEQGLDPRTDLQASDGIHRRRAAYRGDAPENRGNLGDQGVQLVRPLRDVRTRGGIRMPRAVGDAHMGGPVPGGDRGSGHGDLAAGRGMRRARAHIHQPDGHARFCATAPAT